MKDILGKALITGGTIGPIAIAIWGMVKYNPEKRWTPAYILLSVLGIGWGCLQVYKIAYDIKLGSIYHAIGYFISGIVTGIVLTMALVQGTAPGKRPTKPPNQAL
jgi:hypothetical protein